MEIERAMLQMLEVMMEDCGLQKLVDKAAAIMEKPVWLLDRNFRFMTDPGSVYPPPVAVAESYGMGGMNKDTMQLVRKRGLPEAILSSEKPHYCYAQELETSMAIAAVRIRGSAVAFLACCDGKKQKLEKTDLVLLTKVRDMIALELQRRSDTRHEDNTPQARLLKDILNSNGSLSYVHSRMDAVQFQEHPFMRLLVVCAPEGETFPWFTMENQFVQIFGACTYTIHRGNFVMLINQSNDISEYQIGRLENLLQSSSLFACVSYRFSQLSQCHRAYVDTLELQQLHPRLEQQQKCCRYEAYIPEMAAWYLSEKLDRDSLANGAISKLIEYDRQYGQESLKTLQALVACAFNVKCTAELLHVHKNTMHYRVNRLEEILGISFDDSRNVFELTLALSMYQLDPSHG